MKDSLIKWRCRRGMKELDLFLLSFFDECYAQLNKHDKNLFIKLLDCTDPALLAWLMGKEQADAELQPIVEQVRKHKRALNTIN